MEITPLRDLRPRTVWDIVDDAVDVYRSRFALFGGIAAVLLVPYYTLFFLITLLAIRLIDADWAMASIFITLLMTPIYLITGVFHTAATATAVHDLHMGSPTSVATALRRIVARFWPLFAASLAYTLLLFLHTLLLFVGILIAVVYYALVAQVVMIEGRGGFDACRRSRALIGLHAPKVLGLLLLIVVLSLLLITATSSVFEVLLELLPGLQAADAIAQDARRTIVSQIIQSVLGILIAPLGSIAGTLLYYDLRVRREGLDMEMEAAQIGFPIAPDPGMKGTNPPMPSPVAGGAA